MGKIDLDAIAARRAEIAEKLAMFATMRTRLEVEIEELDVTERVLRRLELLLNPETPDAYEPRYGQGEPPHKRVLNALKSLSPIRKAGDSYPS